VWLCNLLLKLNSLVKYVNCDDDDDDHDDDEDDDDDNYKHSETKTS